MKSFKLKKFVWKNFSTENQNQAIYCEKFLIIYFHTIRNSEDSKVLIVFGTLKTKKVKNFKILFMNLTAVKYLKFSYKKLSFSNLNFRSRN